MPRVCLRAVVAEVESETDLRNTAKVECTGVADCLDLGVRGEESEKSLNMY